jgi:hypothetical protein
MYMIFLYVTIPYSTRMSYLSLKVQALGQADLLQELLTRVPSQKVMAGRKWVWVLGSGENLFVIMGMRAFAVTSHWLTSLLSDTKLTI